MSSTVSVAIELLFPKCWKWNLKFNNFNTKWRISWNYTCSNGYEDDVTWIQEIRRYELVAPATIPCKNWEDDIPFKKMNIFWKLPCPWATIYFLQMRIDDDVMGLWIGALYTIPCKKWKDDISWNKCLENYFVCEWKSFLQMPIGDDATLKYWSIDLCFMYYTMQTLGGWYFIKWDKCLLKITSFINENVISPNAYWRRCHANIGEYEVFVEIEGNESLLKNVWKFHSFKYVLECSVVLLIPQYVNIRRLMYHSGE